MAATVSAVLLLFAAAACRLPEAPTPRLALIEKGASQSFFDAEGRLLRLLLDANGDRRADTQVLYRSDGSIQGSEIDTNLDGAVDRWETFRADGSLESVGYSRHGRGRADAWDRLDRPQHVTQRDLDENGDGRVDRSEFFEAGRVTREELDTDGDGRIDRRLHRGLGGQLDVIEIERNGVWERQPVRRP